MKLPYSGNLLSEKNFANLWENGFHREKFGGLLGHTNYCSPSLQTIAEKTFADRHNLESFLSRSFPSTWYIPRTLYFPDCKVASVLVNFNN